MNAAEAMNLIEAPEFCAHVNIASSLRVFLKVIIPHTAIKSLLDSMKTPGVPEAVLNRTLQLVQNDPEDEYEHPADAAMAAYLWVLGEAHPEYAKIAAEAVRSRRQLWWSRQIADRLMDPRRFHSQSGLIFYCPVESAHPVSYSSDAGILPFAMALPLSKSFWGGAAGGRIVINTHFDERKVFFNRGAGSTRQSLAEAIT